MTSFPRGRVAGLAAIALVAVVACSPGTSPTPGVERTAPAALVSPIVGVPIDIDAEGFSKVTAFTIRTADGQEHSFAMGILENGAEFPPNHLAEHLAGSTAVRVFFRREAGKDVVYRLEDAEPAR